MARVLVNQINLSKRAFLIAVAVKRISVGQTRKAPDGI